ncbi:hypothetical protein [Cereibacter sphaeroides]|uniref:hypothetical protein n=1 Tax=Cereibacter sphaeroides TaxID=1063 RepID=UPI000AF6D613|nr:hypothetical protein [Cereibacter sphaeroides]
MGIRQIEGAIATKEETGRLVPVHVHAWNEKRSPDAMTRGEGFSGTLKAMGTAPYQNDPRNRDSFFVTIETRNGEQTVWGAGLQAALERQEASPGSLVHLTVQGQKPVTGDRRRWQTGVRPSQSLDGGKSSNAPRSGRIAPTALSRSGRRSGSIRTMPPLPSERMVLGEYSGSPASRRSGVASSR